MRSNRSSNRLNLSSHAKVRSTRIPNAWSGSGHVRTENGGKAVVHRLTERSHATTCPDCLHSAVLRAVVVERRKPAGDQCTRSSSVVYGSCNEGGDTPKPRQNIVYLS